MSKIWNRINFSKIAYSFLFNILLFGIDFGVEYATDTYSTFEESTWQYMLFQNGRIINGIAYYICEKMHIDNAMCYHLSWSLAILCGTIAVFFLSLTFENELQLNDFFATLLATIVIFNPYCIEYYMFVEKGLFVLGICAAVCAACLLLNMWNQYSDSKNIQIHKLITIELLLLIVIFTYQIILGLFLAILLPFVCVRITVLKQFFVHMIQIGVFYCFNMGVAFLITKIILGSERFREGTVEMDVILPQLRQRLFQSDVVFPKGLLFIWCIVLLIFGVAVIVALGKRVGNILGLGLLVITITLLGLYPFLLWIERTLSYRVMYPLGCLAGALYIFVLFLLTHYSTANKITRIAQVILTVSMIAFWGLQLMSFQRVFIDRYKTNQVDHYIVYMINNAIMTYEQESGETIRYIAYYYDYHVDDEYGDMKADGMNARAGSEDWSAVSYINYYLDRKYETCEKNPQYAEHFEQMDWDVFCEDQLIFDGDTLHYCVY